MGARRKLLQSSPALDVDLDLEGKHPIPSIAPISQSVQSEIAAATDVLLAALCPVPGLARVADIDLSGVKPVPPRRHRSWTQRDVTRLLCSAKAAGVGFA